MARRERLQNIQPINSNFVSPIVYEGYSVDPQEENVGILANRIDKFDQNVREANAQQSAIDIALGEIGSKLNENDQEWFSNYKDDIKSQIREQINLGNYQGAINTATILAGKIQSDNAITGRVKTNQQYQEEYNRQRERIGHGIDQATFDWWVETNPYKFESTQTNGVTTSYKDWKPNNVPVDDLKPEQLAVTAFKLLSPEKHNKSYTGNVKNKTEYTDLTSVNAEQYERIAVEDIINNIENIVGGNPDNWRALRQGFDVAKNELKKLKNEIDSLPEDSEERLLKQQQYDLQSSYFKGSNNGTQLADDESGWKTYYARVITDNMFAKGLAYDWKTIDTKRIAEDPNSRKDDNNKNLKDNEDYSKGNRTTLHSKTHEAASKAKQAVSSASRDMSNSEMVIDE